MTHGRLDRRDWGRRLAATVFAAGCLRAEAATPAAARRWAVASLFGDELRRVTYRRGVGSHLDANQHESFPLGDGYFDRLALKSALPALQATGAAVVALMAPESTALRRDQAQFLENTPARLPAPLVDAAAGAGASHLLLIARSRAPGWITHSGGRLQVGPLEGMGIFVDESMETQRLDTLDRARGFLAPFLHLKLGIVDLSDLTVVATERITAASMVSAARNQKDFDLWNALSSEEKVEQLGAMVRREIDAAVRRLLGMAPASSASPG